MGCQSSTDKRNAKLVRYKNSTIKLVEAVDKPPTTTSQQQQEQESPLMIAPTAKATTTTSAVPAISGGSGSSSNRNAKKEGWQLTFYACLHHAIRDSLGLSELDTEEFIKGVCRAMQHATNNYISYLEKRAMYRPNKQRSKMIQVWLRFDKDSSGDLSASECEAVIVALNLPDIFARRFKKAAMRKGKRDSITFDEFEEIHRSLLDWEELDFIWTAVTNSTEPDTHLSFQQFKMFVKQWQKDDLTDDELEALMLSCGAYPDLTMDKDAFVSYLVDADLNSCIDNDRVTTIHMDMQQPVCNYFINSSHNTYLSGDQLTSDSMPEMYTNALLDGCRCVELDCWDGKEGEPIIYHGYTRTSKISFESVIHAINAASFTASDYPVILSLEVHTSIQQQKRMAELMVSIFGPLLATPTWAPGQDPPVPVSPERYKRTILLKGKRLQHSVDDNEDDDDDEEDEKEQCAEVKFKKKQMAREKKLKKGAAKNSSSAGGGGGGGGAHGGHKIAQELSDLIIVESKGLKNFEEAFRKAKQYECCSFTESKSDGFIKHNMDAYIKHNSLRIARIYPSGGRIDSSNYHPQPHWNAGCQIVALNWQSSETYELRYNKGRFIENGNCGYVLKPDRMRRNFIEAAEAQWELGQNVSGEFFNVASSAAVNAIAAATPQQLAMLLPKRPRKQLVVEVLSAFSLPKPSNASKGEVVDPFIRAFVEGPGMSRNERFETPVVDDNGFHPVWRGMKARRHTSAAASKKKSERKQKEQQQSSPAAADRGYYDENGDNLDADEYDQQQQQYASGGRRESRADDGEPAEVLRSNPKKSKNKKNTSSDDAYTTVHECVFDVAEWEMSTLVLQAWDKDVDADDFLAECIVPLTTLKCGIRAFPMKDIRSKPLTGSFVIGSVTFF